MAFRYAFFQIGNGVEPDSSEWIDPSSRAVGKLGDYKTISREMSESQNLLKVLSEADLGAIAKSCKFPDFLGYLGVALFSTSALEFQSRVLTQSWTPQLLALVRPNGQAEEVLEQRLAGGLTPLSWQDLEAVEKDFDHSSRHCP